MKVNGMEIKSEYTGLLDVFLDALEQAQGGRANIGDWRHGEDFEAQPICEIGRRLSSDFCLGQAVAKIYEARAASGLTGPQAAVEELLGAINCLVAGVIVFREEHFEELFP